MPSSAQAVRIYQELANWHEQQGQPQQRDRFLVLAADAALAAGQGDEAERLRLQLLQLNPHHLLKPYASFAEAVRAGDVQSYLAALRQSNPPEAAERQLAALRAGKGAGPRQADPEPQVFRVRPDLSEPPPARPRQAPPPHSRATPTAVPIAQPASQPVPSAKPRSAPPPPIAARAEVFAPEPHPLPARRPRALEPDEPGSGGGSMMASLLFALLLMVAVGLLFWTLVRPFFSI